MKITKHGKRHNDGRPFKSNCDFCDCEVEVSKDELKMTVDQRDGDYYWVLCPECGQHIYFRDRRLGNDGFRDATVYDR